MFAGNGEERPTYESVIFEIHIDPSEVDEDAALYADIRDVSGMRDEYEVLLCVGIVLRLERIDVRDGVNWILLRVCRYDMSMVKEINQIRIQCEIYLR